MAATAESMSENTNPLHSSASGSTRRFFVLVLALFVFFAMPAMSSAVPAPQPASPFTVQAPGKTTPAKNDSAASAGNTRLSKTIIPIIRKSFDRYPAYYLFIFIAGFILFAIIRIIDPPYLRYLMTAAVNLKLLLNLFKEGIFGFNVVNLLLDLLCIGVGSVFIQVYFFDYQPRFFPWILCFTAVAYFLKLILIQFFANAFMDRSEALIHTLMHLLLTRILGLVLLPVLFVALYQPEIEVISVLDVVLTAVLALYLVWLARLYLKMKSVSVVGFFYLFLYLCTVELSPLALLLRDNIR